LNPFRIIDVQTEATFIHAKTVTSNGKVPMKYLRLTFTLLFAITPLSTWAQSSSPTEFIAAYRTAIQEKSPEKLNAITYSVGMSEADKNQLASHLDTIFNDKPIGEISLESLPATFKSFVIMNGKKLEPTYPPAGMIKIQYETVNGASSSSSRAYAIIDGRYFLVPNKITDVPVHIYPLNPGSDSPDNDYRFVVQKEGDAGAETLVYGFMSLSAGRVVWTIPCAYKLEGADDTWPLKSAQAAHVYWSKDGARFVLDEENYQFMGNAVLGTIAAAKNSVTTHTFVPSDLHMSGLGQWRIRVNKGWITPTTLSLEISGVYDSTGPTPGASFTQDFTCEVNDATHYQFVKQGNSEH